MRKLSAVLKGNLYHCVVVGLLSWGAATWASTPLNVLTRLEVRPTSSGAQVVIAGSRPPTFTVFRLADPDRLVVDVSSSDVSTIRGQHDGRGPVTGVVASQFTDDRASVGRLLVALDHAGPYEVHADGNTVVVAVQGAGVLSKSPSDPNVLASHGDERAVKEPAHSLTSISVKGNALTLLADGEVTRYQVLDLANPPRVALDVYGVGLGTKVRHPHTGPFAGLRAGAHQDKVRFVVDVDGAMPVSQVAFTARGLNWRLDRPDVSPAVAQAKASTGAVGDAEVEIDGKTVPLKGAELAATRVRPEPPAAATPRSSERAEILELTFRDSPQGGHVVLKLRGKAKLHVERPDAQSAVLVLESAHLPKRLERSLDTSALGTPIKMVSAFSVPGAEGKVRIVVAADGALEERVEETPGGLSWRLSAKGVKTEAVSVNEKTAAFTSESVAYAAEGAPQRSEFSGKKVSFEFKDIDIHNLLRVIAEVSKRNVVVSDDVGGKVTIRLRNVPWDQALELILRSKGLGKEEIGNIIRVAPLATLEHEATARAARKLAVQKQEELRVQLVPVNYAKADELSARVKEVLSERGSVVVDTRTNVLIVRDINSGIEKARSLVQNLDTPTPQVLIESRIVEANTTFSRQIGVQWGGAGQAAQGTNNATGLQFPNSVRVAGGLDATGPLGGISSTPNFAVNMPAAVGAGSGGALGFVFGSAGGALALNLRLSALENRGDVKTISAPKVATMDNMAARISQGVSVPYSQVSASGVNTIFIEARLSLDVLPHITQNGSVLMTIKAENNQPDPASTGANGQPAIQRKEASTQVLVKDGDTTVIGGIYVRRTGATSAMVPFFAHIPIIGFFFRTDTEGENRQELLIFITPRILNRQTIAQESL